MNLVIHSPVEFLSLDRTMIVAGSMAAGNAGDEGDARRHMPDAARSRELVH